MRKILSLLIGVVFGTMILTIVYASSGEIINVLINKCSLEVNEEPIQADNFLYNDRMYVPLRAVSESLGMDVEWDEINNAVRIYNDKYDKISNASKDEFIYKNIKFSMSPEDVEKVFGKPVSIKNNNDGNYISFYYYYNDCRIGFSKMRNTKDVVWDIQINSELYKSVEGVGIGDRTIDVIKKYGKPHYGETEFNSFSPEYNYLIYLDENSEHAIEFYFDNEYKIKSIVLNNGLVG